MTPAGGAAAAPDLWTRPILCVALALALLCTLLALVPAGETVPGTAPTLAPGLASHLAARLPQALVPLASEDIGAGEQAFGAHARGARC